MEKKKKAQPVKSRFGRLKFKDWVIFLVVVSAFGYTLYNIGRRRLGYYLLDEKAQRTRAVIIDEKNYKGNSPVSGDADYSYLFYINGKAYKNNSHDSKLQIGDSIDVEYLENWPEINRPISARK